MALYIQGNSVANATSYVLKNVLDDADTTITTASSINFNLNNLSLDTGVYEFAVKATASGYTDSDDSNTIACSTDGSTIQGITLLTPTSTTMGYRVQASDGAVITAAGNTTGHRVYENIDDSATLYYYGYVPGHSGTSCAVAFYDANGDWISTLKDQNFGDGSWVVNKQIPIPEGTATIKTQVYQSINSQVYMIN